AFQSDLPRGHVVLERIKDDAARLPLEAIVRHRVLPQADAAGGRTILLTASPLAEPVVAELSGLVGGVVVQEIVREGEIAAGLRVLRGVEIAAPAGEGGQAGPTGVAQGASAGASSAGGAEPVPPRSVPLIGDLLIEHGHVRREAFEAAMQDYRPDRHGRIGDYMVARGVISRAALENVIEQQRRLQGALAASE
ncbi:MAG: glycosyl transferase family protein, partial [Paraburkholderia nemoris]